MSRTKYPMHKHHIVPRYQGGTNDSTNLKVLSISDHANEHKKLYEQFGRLEDKLAWLGLAGLKDKNEWHQTMASLGGRIVTEQKLGIHQYTSEERAACGRIGGPKGGKVVGQMMWITDGNINKRIPPGNELPIGFFKGRSNFRFTKKRKKEASTRLRHKGRFISHNQLLQLELPPCKPIPAIL